MTPEEMRARLEAIATEMDEILAADEFDEDRFKPLKEEADGLRDKIARAKEVAEVRNLAEDTRNIEVGDDKKKTPDPVNANVRSDDDPYGAEFRTSMFDSPTKIRAELRARAEKAVEIDEHMTDGQKESALRTLARAENPSSEIAKRFLATGNPEYRSAWVKLMNSPQPLLTNEEHQAVERAMSLTDNAGGYGVPFTLDPTIIYTGSGAENPFREVSRIVQTTTNEWNGLSSAGISASYDAEATQVSDDSFVLAQPNIPVHKAQGFVPFSIEIDQDWSQFASETQELLKLSRDELETLKFTLGTGTNEPTGIVTALVASAGSASIVTPTTAETFAVADVYKVLESTPPRYRQNGNWMAELSIYNDVRQFDNNGGADMWVTLGGGLPSQLVGKPAFENSAMDSGFDATATANNYELIFGDFRHFVIVDRVGMSTELVPHLFGANGRPTGQRGIYAYWRNGSDSVNDNAFRMLNIATAA